YPSLVHLSLYSSRPTSHPHSFPTRRSSDLDFSDCNFITREGDGNWRYLLAHGGEGLGLSTKMPAFADVLTDGQIQATLDYLRGRSEEHTSELQSRGHLVCRLLLEKKKENYH